MSNHSLASVISEADRMVMSLMLLSALMLAKSFVMLLRYSRQGFLSSFFSLFLPNLQALENLLRVIQNLNQNLVAELAPLDLGDLAFLELVELDRVFVCHGVTLVDAVFFV